MTNIFTDEHKEELEKVGIDVKKYSKIINKKFIKKEQERKKQIRNNKNKIARKARRLNRIRQK